MDQVISYPDPTEGPLVNFQDLPKEEQEDLRSSLRALRQEPVFQVWRHHLRLSLDLCVRQLLSASSEVETFRLQGRCKGLEKALTVLDDIERQLSA